MLCSEIIAVCSEIHTKHINTSCGQNVELVVSKVATGLSGVNYLTQCWRFNTGKTSVSRKGLFLRLSCMKVAMLCVRHCFFPAVTSRVTPCLFRSSDISTPLSFLVICFRVGYQSACFCQLLCRHYFSLHIRFECLKDVRFPIQTFLCLKRQERIGSSFPVSKAAGAWSWYTHMQPVVTLRLGGVICPLCYET
jgi:hypothetical protein